MHITQTRTLSPFIMVSLAFGLSVAHAEDAVEKTGKNTAKVIKSDTARQTNACRRDVLRLAKRKKLVFNKPIKDGKRLISKACIKAKFKRRAALKIAFKNQIFIKNDAQNEAVSNQKDQKRVAHSDCIRAVFDLAKRNKLVLKDNNKKSSRLVRDACTEARFKPKVALKMAKRAGAFATAAKGTQPSDAESNKTADKKEYLKTCQREIKAHARDKKLIPTVRGGELKNRIIDSCKDNKFDGYLALKALFKSGIFTKSDNGETNQEKGTGLAERRDVGQTAQKKKKTKTGTQKQSTLTPGPNKLKTCVKKVKYRVKSDKLFPRKGVKSLNLEIRDACNKAKLNPRRSFGLIKRYLTKKHPNSNTARSKTKKKTSSGQKKNTIISLSKKQEGASKKSLSTCKTQVWAISEKEGLKPIKGKSNVNKHILEQCRLNAYVPSTVFRKVRKLFVAKDGSNKTTQSTSSFPSIGPSLKRIGQSNQIAIPTGNINQSRTTKESKACHLAVAKILKAKGNQTVNKHPKKEFNRRVVNACQKTNNDAKAAATILLKSSE
ncbi:MAG: hypothetical protein VYA30_00875 [Myxococcota bacterium]|nr:hypothetical protein [Myxococcota bacterium]